MLGYDISFINKDIGSYQLNNDIINKIYGPEYMNKDSRDKFKSLLSKYYKPKDYNLTTMYYFLFNKPKTTFNDIKNYKIRQILLAISYYQNNYFKINPTVDFLPYTLMKRLDASYNIGYYIISKIKCILKINEYLVKKQIDINCIIKSINENKPLVIAVFNNNLGHALLAYAYEFIGNNFLKVYVQDCNIPLFSQQDKFNKINNSIKNNCYILFGKYNGKWYYKYDPVINNKYIYSHQYNSFMPEGTIRIY